MLSRAFWDDVENKQAHRKRQIDTLKIFNDNVTEIKEDSEYKVEFLVGDTLTCIIVSLPPDFPCEKPSLRVHPTVRHAWVGGNSEIDSAPGLVNFTAHSDLGRVVQVIVRELQLRGATQNNMPSSSVPGGTGALNLTNSRPHLVVASLPELAALNTEEMQQLNDDPQQLHDFVMSTQQVDNMSKMVESRISEIEGLAEGNLSKQGRLEQLREKVLKHVEEAQNLKASFDERNRQFETLSQQYQPENIKEALKSATKESDEHAEAIADEFLNGTMDIDQFLVSYVDERKLSQCRKTKEEKLSNQLHHLKRAAY